MSETRWPTHAPIEVLAYGDTYIEEYATAIDSIFTGLGDILRSTWAIVRPRPDCDCAIGLPHRWDCELTPIYAQMVKDNPCLTCGHDSHPGQHCGHPIYDEQSDYVGGMILTRTVSARQCPCGLTDSYL